MTITINDTVPVSATELVHVIVTHACIYVYLYVYAFVHVYACVYISLHVCIHYARLRVRIMSPDHSVSLATRLVD